jgi:zinc and cadmium transporter
VTVLASLVSVFLVSLVSLVGLFTLSMKEARIRRAATFFVSFAVGALLGDAFIHLIPEIFGEAAPPQTTLARSLLILAGVLLFFVVEKLIRHRHGLLHEHHHPDHVVKRPELAAINLLGDAIHNFIDGVVIGASYIVSPTLGLSTTFAVMLHEIPQELGDFGVLVHSGVAVRKAVLLNLASASVAILGTAVALLLGTGARETVAAFLLPVTAGGFVYLAAANLIPELQHDKSMRALLTQTSLIAAGLAIMALLTELE